MFKRITKFFFVTIILTHSQTVTPRHRCVIIHEMLIRTMFGHQTTHINLPQIVKIERFGNCGRRNLTYNLLYWYALNVFRMSTDCVEDASIAMYENTKCLARNRSQHIWNYNVLRFSFVSIILQALVTTISHHLRVQPRRRDCYETTN